MVVFTDDIYLQLRCFSHFFQHSYFSLRTLSNDVKSFTSVITYEYFLLLSTGRIYTALKSSFHKHGRRILEKAVRQSTQLLFISNSKHQVWCRVVHALQFLT